MRRDLSGRTFGRLTALEVSGRDAWKRYIWRCKCSCGTVKSVPSRHLVQGLVRSCGCLGARSKALNGFLGAYKISGPRSYLYNPALTAEQRIRTRNVEELRVWRGAVFAAARFTCDLCGQYGGRLEAHHLDGWSKYPEKRFDVTNGVALCRRCHRGFHDYMGGARKSCSAADYFSFKTKIAA